MKIIADCGSTKIAWALLDGEGNENAQIVTNGYNAVAGTDGDLESLIRTEATELTYYADRVAEIEFYGAGCGSELTCERVRKELMRVFANANCEVASDMLAAARALCGNKPGVVAILGTGSNSCLYDGENIVSNVSPLGFILGDEGSGAVLGRKLLGGILKRQFSAEVRRRFAECFPTLQPSEIIEEVYRGKRARAFLASFAPFIAANIELEEIDRFVTEEFMSFFTRNVLLYRDEKHEFISDWGAVPINFTGSIAVNFQRQLRKAAETAGCLPGVIIQSPIDRLIELRGKKIR